MSDITEPGHSDSDSQLGVTITLFVHTKKTGWTTLVKELFTYNVFFVGTPVLFLNSRTIDKTSLFFKCVRFLNYFLLFNFFNGSFSQGTFVCFFIYFSFSVVMPRAMGDGRLLLVRVVGVVATWWDQYHRLGRTHWPLLGPTSEFYFQIFRCS